MTEPSADLAGLLVRHEAVGAEPAARVVEEGRLRARARDEEQRQRAGVARLLGQAHRPQTSWLTLAKFYREALDSLPAPEKVSASVVLLAEAARWPNLPFTMVRAVRRAGPPFSVADLQLLLRLESEAHVDLPPQRLEYAALIVERLDELRRTEVSGTRALAALLVDHLMSWTPASLDDRGTVQLRELRRRALALSGASPCEVEAAVSAAEAATEEHVMRGDGGSHDPREARGLVRATSGGPSQAYRAMLRDHIGPALRSEGLRGSAGEYMLPSATHFAMASFQRSSHRDPYTVKFTINLEVVPKDAWEEARLPLEPRPRRGAMPARVYRRTIPGHWESRIGETIPVGHDKWWWLQVDDLPEEYEASLSRHAEQRYRREHDEEAEELPDDFDPIKYWYDAATYDYRDPVSVASDVIAALRDWGLPALRGAMQQG